MEKHVGYMIALEMLLYNNPNILEHLINVPDISQQENLVTKKKLVDYVCSIISLQYDRNLPCGCYVFCKNVQVLAYNPDKMLTICNFITRKNY